MAPNGHTNGHSTDKKVWVITGCSSGLGGTIAEAALNRGDIVVATARNTSKLSALAERGALLETLDVTSPDNVLAETAERIASRTGGRIDILVNNAGYILAGGVEEASRAEAQATFETNVFGQLNVLRAVLPIMRRNGPGGVVANLGSIGGWHGTPGAGLYCATKACCSLLSEALRAEVAHLGIQVTAIEPGYTRTDFLASGHQIRAKKVIDELRPGIDPTIEALTAYSNKQPGDPVKLANLVVEALTLSGRCKGRTLPPRLLIGADAYQIVSGNLRENEKWWKEWEDLCTATNCDDVK
ncbi:serine 3-dehydrogenase [Xylariaceae sp. FL0255]|nr:serine 3-dehydrogenase [Xylariaceae sp. FL0255]